jgi:N-acetylmuramoyl-L-alanine amidase
MPVHTVAQGECLLSIAEANGFFWETLWNHPDNEGLKAERKDPAILFPGDKVFVPEKRMKELNEPTNQVHKYRVKNVPAKLKVRFLDDGDKPRANIKYSLMIDGKEFSGVTDGDGAINVSIPPDARKGTLVFEDKAEEYEFALGHLDPVEEISGVQARLAGLGHYTGEATGSIDEKTKEAIKEFQESIGVEPTGELDQKLKNDLKSAYGS